VDAWMAGPSVRVRVHSLWSEAGVNEAYAGRSRSSIPSMYGTTLASGVEFRRAKYARIAGAASGGTASSISRPR
jgi:hypothetical protein